VTLPAGAVIADNIVTDTSPQLGGALDTNGFAITSSGSNPVTIDPAGSGTINMGAPVVFDATQPTASTASANIVQLTNDYQAGSTTLAATASAVKSLMPVGSVIMYAGATAPAGYLECNGQSTSGYADLATIVGANVPDLRGQFVRGWDNGAGVDSGRALLSNQAGTFASHNHSLTNGGNHNHSLGSAGNHAHGINSVGNHAHSGSGSTSSDTHTHGHSKAGSTSDDDSGYPSGSGGSLSGSFTSGTTNSDSHSHSVNISIGNGGGHNHSMNNGGNHNHSLANAGTHAHSVGSTGSTENRPSNIALMYCIKY